ncbi:MAG TPA: class IV adenylate cyclase [Chitinophagaceae bacterium]|nr:class IV adenylate cyclase [Chitinophagaceae bacterium]
MAFINIEIKARTTRADAIRQYLISKGAEFRGKDHQSDTYFNVPNGRLKLREGNIENNLIYYHRPETAGLKQSDVELVGTPEPAALKTVLTQALGVKAVVRKQREIYYIGNVKFHIDTLEGLGSFVEIEACSDNTSLSKEDLQDQCRMYMDAFGVEEKDLVNKSYSDMVITN